MAGVKSTGGEDGLGCLMLRGGWCVSLEKEGWGWSQVDVSGRRLGLSDVAWRLVRVFGEGRMWLESSRRERKTAWAVLCCVEAGAILLLRKDVAGV